MVVSFLVDIFSLPEILMMEERNFEPKYQMQRIAKDKDVVQLIQIFDRVLRSEKVFQKSRAHNVRNIEDMVKMHSKIFRNIDQFHSFFCRGDKNFRQSIQNVKVFNLTKIISVNASLPDSKGLVRNNSINYHIIKNVMDDVVLYNFFYFSLDAHKRGLDKETLKQEVQLYSEPTVNYTFEKHHLCNQTFVRTMDDFVCMLNINQISKSYTDILERIKNYHEETEYFQQLNKFKELKRSKGISFD